MEIFGIPKTANFECRFGSELENYSIQNFGYEFVAKRNVTFSWVFAVCLK